MQNQPLNIPLTAIILAGGRSSRMGRDKALIAIAGVPLLTRTCQIALACAKPVYIVTSWPERYRDRVPSACQFICEVPVPETLPPPGPLVGFTVGLAEVKTDWVLLLACDLPRLRLEVLQEWIALLANVPPEVSAVLPRNPKGWEPLCGFYRSSCLPSLTAFIQQEGRSFQRWLNSQTVQELPVSDPQILLNCNTPEDLRATSVEF